MTPDPTARPRPKPVTWSHCAAPTCPASPCACGEQVREEIVEGTA